MGKCWAFRRDGRPHPFQTTMRRFGRKLDVAALRRELPLTPYFFDCLYLDGETLIDLPGRRAHRRSCRDRAQRPADAPDGHRQLGGGRGLLRIGRRRGP